MGARPSITVAAALVRTRFLIAARWAARIRDREAQRAYVVDGWYFDNGHPAAVFAVEEWLAGKNPDGA